ncbi:MAG: TRAP transporter fused permease subunit [Hyphomicrobiaceae bacterium]|nr:TRAP transporter fused permease subunit [Hyphomicrobiaceae bacterium]
MKTQVSPSIARAIVACVALGLSVVQFYPFVARAAPHQITFLSIHVGAALAIAFLIIGFRARREAEDSLPLLDLAFAAAALTCAGYFALQGERVAERIEGVDPVYTADIIFGCLLILLLIEACRRVAGLVLTAITVLFIVFTFAGPYLPNFIGHSGMSLARFIDLQVLSTQGIFGTPISASANLVFYFIVVGAFLERSGAGRLFVDLAYALTARTWGGAGKAAVVSSGLIGTVSGSAVANVLMSGIVTIPLMKRGGFKPNLAGAIEATASTGGQLAPPIMGAAAFILADIVGVSYANVAFAAIVPAVLYYLSLFMLVHFHSLRVGLAPDRDADIKAYAAEALKRWHLMLPLFLMVYLLMSHYSMMTVGVYTTIAIIAVAAINAATRLGLKAMLEALTGAAKAVAEVAIPSAVAGIIVGTLVQTGMALQLQRWLLNIAGGSLLLTLIGTMVLTIILGMGMPTAAAYLVSAILVAPALQELGVPALAAHLFVFYFAILSMVTPPVALAGYAAAGLSGGNLWQTGLLAFLIAIPGFLIPYAFVFDSGLLMQADALHNARVIASAFVGVTAMSAAGGGYAFGPLSWPARILLFSTGPLLIDPSHSTDLIGGALIAAVVAYQLMRRRLGQTRVTGPLERQPDGDRVQ